MKKTFLLMMASAVILASCGSNAVEATEAKKEAEATEKSVEYVVDAKSSEVQWHGKKLAYGHTGLIDIKSGSLAAENEKITAGKFEIDMNTIRETGDVDPEDAIKLAGHLMDVDFFDAASFPLSTFEITGVKGEKGNYEISGNLIIKGVSKNITFPAEVKLEGDQLTANAEVIINRTDWGVVYGSGVTGAVADKAISDDIDFKIKLVANKK